MRTPMMMFCLVGAAFGQLQNKNYAKFGVPPTVTFDLSEVKVPNHEELMAEDTMNLQGGEKTLRIAELIDKRITLSEFSNVNVDGGKLFTLGVKSPNAFALGVTFGTYKVPAGARLFLYNEHTTRGAYTDVNMKPYGGFTALPVKGDHMVIELFVPFTANGTDVQLVTESFAHHYKNNWFGSRDPEVRGCYGCSGSCNVNERCPLGDGWHDDAAGVAAILRSSGSALCSGSMINNVAQDGTQYFLSANHCGGASAQDWIVVFNYYSNNCVNDPTEPSDDDSVQGTSLISRNGREDFVLLELFEPIPASYGVQLNGFDARDESMFQVPYAISHPSGDVSKVAISHAPAIPSGYFSEGDSHWYVAEWDAGVTEGGSSGSPIFDDQHRIRGQLHGGQARCGYPFVDYYGRISESWTAGTEPTTRLSVWLDPDRTGELVVDRIPLEAARANGRARKEKKN